MDAIQRINLTPLTHSIKSRTELILVSSLLLDLFAHYTYFSEEVENIHQPLCVFIVDGCDLNDIFI